MTSETAITTTITKNLTKCGIFWLKLHGSPYQRQGMPDLLVVKEGRAYFFEVKRPGQKPTPLQERRLLQCRQAGAGAKVVHSWIEVDAWLELDRI